MSTSINSQCFQTQSSKRLESRFNDSSLDRLAFYTCQQFLEVFVGQTISQKLIYIRECRFQIFSQLSLGFELLTNIRHQLKQFGSKLCISFDKTRQSSMHQLMHDHIHTYLRSCIVCTQHIDHMLSALGVEDKLGRFSCTKLHRRINVVSRSILGHVNQSELRQHIVQLTQQHLIEASISRIS